MKVLLKSVYVVDNNADLLKHIKKTTPDLDEYIKSTMDYVTNHKSTKRFKPRRENTEVIACSREIVTHVIKQNNSDLDDEKIYNNFHEIAERLFNSEKEVQAGLNKNLKSTLRKGSFIQALVYDDRSDKYLIVFIKVNHTLYLHGEKFRIEDGIILNKKDWRSCQFNINTDDVSYPKFESADVYLDTNAKYWTNDFLELDEETTDEKNTQNAFNYIDKILVRTIKRNYPYDHTHIRNAFVFRFRQPGIASFEEIVSDILDGYEPHDSDVKKIKELKKKLLSDKGIDDFDHQFNIIPTAVNAKIKKEYNIRNGIELKIYDGVENLDKVIDAYEDEIGDKYIKILVENEDTYNSFSKPMKKPVKK